MVATHSHCKALVRLSYMLISGRLAQVVAFPAPLGDSRVCRGMLTQAQG